MPLAKTSLVSNTFRRKALDLHALKQRGLEEQSLLQEEMQNVLRYFKDVHSAITEQLPPDNNQVDDIPSSTPEKRGVQALLYKKLFVTEEFILALSSQFGKFTNVENFVPQFGHPATVVNDESDETFSGSDSVVSATDISQEIITDSDSD